MFPMKKPSKTPDEQAMKVRVGPPPMKGGNQNALAKRLGC